jgi:hypothetical protein
MKKLDSEFKSKTNPRYKTALRKIEGEKKKKMEE